MVENWVSIDGFPKYKVSDQGRVLNVDSGRIMRESRTRTGIVKIGLFHDGAQHTRSVCTLVATAFVDGRSELFDTPTHLDCNHENNTANNLVWRPRWFAWKYRRQFTESSVHHDRGPVIDEQSKTRYSTMFQAALDNGLLVEDIWKSILLKKPTFPTGQLFLFKK